jgi:GMP synthase PP-ATPase subunit
VSQRDLPVRDDAGLVAIAVARGERSSSKDRFGSAVKGIWRAVHDLSGMPPATIEWE